MNTDPQNISKKELETIERYLRGELNKERRAAFENRINEDEDFRQTVQEFQQLIEGVETASLKTKLDEFHTEIEEGTSTSGEPSHAQFERKPLFVKYLVAALLLLAFGLTLWFVAFQQSPEEELFAAYFEPDPGLITPMSSTDEYEFYSGMIDYKRENYQDAISKWKPLISENPESDTLNYFLGVAHLSLGEQEEAQTYLEANLKAADNNFRNEAYYYLGLVYLKSGDRNAAAGALTESNDDRAGDLLNELEGQK